MQASNPDSSGSKIPLSSAPSSYARVKKGDEKEKETEGIEVEKMVSEAASKRPRHKTAKSLPPGDKGSLPKVGQERQRFLHEVKEKSLEKKFKKLKKARDKTQTQGREGFQFEKIGGSQNVVERAAAPRYFPYGKMTSIRTKEVAWDDVEEEIRQFCKEQEMDDMEEAKFISALKEDLQPVFENLKGSPAEKMEKVMAEIKKFAGSLIAKEDMKLRNNLELLLKRLTPLSESAVAFEMNNVPVLHHKDELIALLRLWSSLASEEKEKSHLEVDADADQLSAAINRLLQMPEDYLDQDALFSILTADTPENPFSGQMVKGGPVSSGEVKGLSDQTSRRILGSLQPYCSSYDILAANQNNPFIGKVLSVLTSDAVSNQFKEFAIKEGAENIREILAQKLLSSLDLGRLFVLKAPLSGDHRSITGEWLTEGKNFPSRTLNALMQAKKSLINESSRSKRNEEKILQLKKEIKTQEDELLQFFEIDPSDHEARAAFDIAVQEHILVDLLLGSFDSHSNQYKIQDGVPLCFDFARFLPPGMFHTEESLNFEDPDHNEVNTYFDFRSFFLDMPVSERPMDTTLINLIQSWDIGEIEASLRAQGLVGDPEKFADAIGRLEKLQSIRLQAQKLSYRLMEAPDDPKANLELKQLLERLSEEFNLNTDALSKAAFEKAKSKFDESHSEEEKNKIFQIELMQGVQFFIYKLEGMQKRENAVLFNQIHPEAFDRLKGRIGMLQDYVQKENPTLLEAFTILYPDAWKFMKEFRKITLFPASDMFVEEIKGHLKLRSLERLVDLLESRGLPKRLADQLRNEIVRIRADESQTKSHAHLSVAMGSGF